MTLERTGSVLRGGIVLLLIPALILGAGVSAAEVPGLQSQTSEDGKQVVCVSGAGLPPEGGALNTNIATNLTKHTANAVDAADVPRLKWSYGSGPTAGAMLFGYYDRHRYTNMYTGPTNGGVFPLTNAAWGASTEGYGQCPLAASQQGLDGRTTRGHKDDYYLLKSSTTDPYFGAWTEHATPDCLADYMGTNMYQKYGNLDSESHFFFSTTDITGKNYDLDDASTGNRDGTYGMKLFAQSRGYTVSTCYNQITDSYATDLGLDGGFSYTEYKDEIDGGYPVVIIMGPYNHAMLGVGYSDPDQIIVHDTLDYAPHIMTWGGYYYGAEKHMGVGVIHLQSVLTPATDKIGVWRNSDRKFYLDYTGNGFYSAAEDRAYTFGVAGDKPVSGDWNNNRIAEIGVYRPSTHKWYLDVSGNGAYGAGDRTCTFGAAGDLPVTGDWNFDGRTEIGVWRPSTHQWFLDYDNSGTYVAANDRTYTLGANGDKPVTGDWNGDGRTNIGVFRPSTRQWFLDVSGNGAYGNGDWAPTFGAVGDIPVTGDWDKNKNTNIGVFRPSTHQWFLDYDDSGTYSAGSDREYTLGANGDQPVTGAWSGTAGSASIESMDLTETTKPAPAVHVPGVSMPVSAIPRVEMPVKSSTVVTPATTGGTPANQNPLAAGGGVKIPEIP